MLTKKYKFKFYLNARHILQFSDSKSKEHPHTWEIVITIYRNENIFFKFSDIEKDVQFFLSIYEGQLLNEIPPFNIIEPTLENIGEVIFEQIKRILKAKGWILEKLEISENPARTYVIECKANIMPTKKKA